MCKGPEAGRNIKPVIAWRRLVWPGQRERGEHRLESGGSQPIGGLQDFTGVMAFICSRLRRSQQEENWLAGDWRQVPSVEAEVTEGGVYRPGELLLARTHRVLSGWCLVTL